MSAKIFKISLESPNIKTEFNEETCKLTVKQDISYLIRDDIVPFKDGDKLYFMDKDTLEIISEFDREYRGI